MVVVLTLNFAAIVGGLPTSSSSTSEPGRNLLGTENVSEPARKSDDTVRVDPLDHLKKYRGGFDITNKNYWSSTIFTGVYGYAIGVLWLLCGLGYGGFLLAINFCCKNNNRKLKKRSPCHKKCYLWPILLLTFFTILAITASGLVLGGNAKFHSRAKTVVDIIIDTADGASVTIYNTTGAMKNISTSLEESNQGGEASGFLTSTSLQLDSEAANIQRQARKNRRAIDKGLKIVYILTTVIISFNLVAVIALSAFGILKFRRTLHLFIILCWLLTVLCWLFFGVYFFIEKFSGDACTALEDFQRDPNNSSLSSILPCNELLSAKSVLNDVSAGIYGLVDEVNTNISLLQAPYHICNPFSPPPEYQYQPENCPANTIRIGDIPEVLKLFTCSEPSDANNGTCNGGVVISTSDFRRVVAYSSSIQTLLNAYPGMENLVECQTVKDAFSEILHKHCKPLKRYARMVWAAMVFLSTVMVAFVLIWITEAYHEQKHHFSDGSVKPHSTTASRLESGTAKAINNASNPSSVL
ncbi:hypothetical protein F0562_006211 [Nyssa sinensis]|uniref:Transmembrane protein n=1 Tax=Nyssa sinensis TaxID=561372 RepID=A0A5J5ANZ3_9ASTE|nr:hypothetical protein F0562_006211 [Nyssa sinensis]